MSCYNVKCPICGALGIDDLFVEHTSIVRVCGPAIGNPTAWLSATVTTFLCRPATFSPESASKGMAAADKGRPPVDPLISDGGRREQ